MAAKLRLTKLTPDQETLLPVIRDEWLAVGLSTERADRARAEAGVRYVVLATEAYRDAVNGIGHAGEPHDQILHEDLPGPIQIYSTSTDCARCGGAQYGTEDTLTRAMGDLREAMGYERHPWQEHGLDRAGRDALDAMAAAREWTKASNNRSRRAEVLA